MTNSANIDYFSLVPLYLEMFINGGDSPIGIGTGFTVKYKRQNFFITNWHNVTGRNFETNEILNKTGYADPDYIELWFNTDKIGQWDKKKIDLKTPDGNKCWSEHPIQKFVDVVAIPYALVGDFQMFPIDLNNLERNILLYPSQSVSIIGFPNGLTSGGKLPIWKKGHIASEPDIDYKGKPMFLIDATTRSGMSGSPVIVRGDGASQTNFLGIYSSRIDNQSEIGMVWKPRAIIEVLENHIATTHPHTYLS